MSRRRETNNRIRGPQSALTDFLASNNISAVQIRDDYERRRQAALQSQQEPTSAGEGDAQTEVEKPKEAPEQTKKRKKQQSAAIAKIKQSKNSQRRQSYKNHSPDGSDDEIAWDTYEKSKPLPGQLENCEICDKRFTVTAYSKTGPGGALLCTKCSKEIDAEKKKDARANKQTAGREKRRQIQSNLLDGIVQVGSKSLQDLCVEKVAANINDVDEFGDLPPFLLNRLSQILSKKRVITARTLDLFLRSDLETVEVYDCGNLGTADFIRIFAIVPRVEKLNLRNAGQMKDEVIDYILERNVPLRHLELEASNLISDDKWRELFNTAGRRLETIKLSWLDYSMDNDTVKHLTGGCPNLRRLKLKKCFRISNPALEAISALTNLEHLSLHFITQTSAEALRSLISAVGVNLRTLSLEHFEEADDRVLSDIHDTCVKLVKLRFTDNDYCTDEAFSSLFADWANPPLSFVDLSSNRDLDCSRPDGPEEAVGLASSGFLALMEHSGSQLKHLDISSCRHITHDAFTEVFDGVKIYPFLRSINISFLTRVDTFIVSLIFKSCPAVAKVTAFGCFNVKNVNVPMEVALIGLPNAQDSIINEGDYTGEL